MKPAALEIHKEQKIADIEFNLDTLLKAKGITFEQVTPPVRNPSYRTLQALERINAKLALVMEAFGAAPVREAKAAVLSEPDEPEAADAQAPETPVEDPQEAQPEEAEAAEPVNKPGKKTKSK